MRHNLYFTGNIKKDRVNCKSKFQGGAPRPISRASGVSRVTITQGMAEISSEGYEPRGQSRCRKEGGGRKQVVAKKPELLHELDELLEPYYSLWTLNSQKN